MTEPLRTSPKELHPTWNAVQRRRWRVIVAIVLALLMGTALAGAWQDFTMEVAPYHVWDAGPCLQGGRRLAEGEIPYRDFLYLWPPLSPALMAASFRVFGQSMWAAKIPLAVFFAAAIPLTYRWLRYTVGRPAALAGSIAVWATGPVMLRSAYASPFTLAPALFAFIQLERMRPGRLFGPALWAGAACGLCIGLKHNVGIILGVLIWVRMLCVTPYAYLTPATAGSGTGRATTRVRGLATAVALAALAALMVRFPSVGRSQLIALGPAAVLLAAGAYYAWQVDSRAKAAVDWRELLLACGCLGLVVVATTAPWLTWLAAHDALVPFLEHGGMLSREGDPDWPSFHARKFQPPLPTLGVLGIAVAAGFGVGTLAARRSAVRWLLAVTAVVTITVTLALGRFTSYLTMCYAPLILLLGAGLRPAEDATRWRRFLAVVTAAWFVVQAFPVTTVTHSTEGMVPALALAVAWSWDLARPVNWPARTAVVSVVAALLFCWWVEWFDALVQHTGTRWVRRPLARAAGPRGGTWMPATMAAQLATIDARVNLLSPPGTPIIGWPNLALLNFYTGRPNPTAVTGFAPGLIGPELEARVLQALKDTPPALVVVDHAPSFVSLKVFEAHHPALMEYVNTHYERSGPFTGSWAVMTRAGTPAPSEH